VTHKTWTCREATREAPLYNYYDYLIMPNSRVTEDDCVEQVTTTVTALIVTA